MAGEKELEKLQLLLLRARTDQELRDKLISSPRVLLKEEGLELPPHVDIELREYLETVDGGIGVDESSDTKLYLPLLPFIGDKIPDEELDNLTGGNWQSTRAPSEFEMMLMERMKASSRFWH